MFKRMIRKAPPEYRHFLESNFKTFMYLNGYNIESIPEDNSSDSESHNESLYDNQISENESTNDGKFTLLMCFYLYNYLWFI